jgi:Tat protein translocase TatB subunit
MFNLGILELLFLGAIALIVIGPKQLPEVARAVAKVLNELRGVTGELTESLMDAKSEVEEFKQETSEAVMKKLGVDKVKSEFDKTVTAVSGKEASSPGSSDEGGEHES